ncbi:DUF427 domain-containing protein [Pedococcus sp. 2YAF34]|uniref:DUF427 domain-containing protein n=1 Tax=Pedococcus sp. 2YAF34 TaxID=3233032 RepID=UPI003F9618B9
MSPWSGHPAPDPVGPGQESVWSYPRPPRVEPSRASVEVWVGGERIALTTLSWRVLETSHPPTYYLPRAAFVPGSLQRAEGTSYCEWKGFASYLDLLGGGAVAQRAGWFYPEPTRGFELLAGAVSVMPGLVDRCVVGGEVVRAQEGGFYGGWVTDRVVGPFKGGPGTHGW